MKTVAIVCEYNPFHLGHAHQIKEIKKCFGEDTAIVAIMSGNYVQRGTPAILGKFARAKAAVDSGASLVLELPFPFCAASCEYFADAAVSLAEDLGIIDILSFGSECGHIENLEAIAKKMLDPLFQREWKKRLTSKQGKEKGYARLLTEALVECGTEDAPFLNLPNNILAISYISSLLKRKSNIIPHTIKRIGDDQCAPENEIFAGATYLRELLVKGDKEAFFAQIPKETHPIWDEALKEGLAPISEDRLSPILLSHLRLCDASPETVWAECGGGVLPLLKKSAKSAVSYQELILAATTKKYTAARIRRASLFSFFGVTPDMIKSKPLYTQVLAMDGVGRSLLASIRKTTGISLLTKPADLGKLSADAQKQAVFSYRADSIYTLLSPKAQSMDIFLRTAPYCK